MTQGTLSLPLLPVPTTLEELLYPSHQVQSEWALSEATVCSTGQKWKRYAAKGPG